MSLAGEGGVGVSPPPPLFEAWLVAISSKCRSCWARSRGKSCRMAPILAIVGGDEALAGAGFGGSGLADFGVAGLAGPNNSRWLT